MSQANVDGIYEMDDEEFSKLLHNGQLTIYLNEGALTIRRKENANSKARLQ